MQSQSNKQVDKSVQFEYDDLATHKSFTTKFSIFACLEIFVCFIRQPPLLSSLVPPNKKLMKYFPGNNTLQTAEHTVQYSTVQYSTVQ